MLTKLYLIFMSKKLSLLSTLILFSLTACGTPTYNYQATYRIIHTPDTQSITLESIKPALEDRLATSAINNSVVSIVDGELVADISHDTFDIATAGGFGTPFHLTLEEPRTELTQSEKDTINTYNQKQREMMQDAYNQAQSATENIDTVVLEFSEQTNQMPKGIRGPYNKLQVKDELYWNELVKTDAGKLTSIVEKPGTIWFARVLEKNITDPNNQTVKYQQVVRQLQRPEPYLDHVPVIHLSQYIDAVEEIKKDPNSPSNKNYAVKVVLNDEGTKELSKITETHKGKTLRFALDGFPYASLFIDAPITDGTLIIDDDYNQLKTSQLVAKLRMPYLPVGLSITSVTKR